MHVVTVVLSGTLFAVRGVFVQKGASWPMIGPLRYLSYAIDTCIVITAALLLIVLPASVYANGWLAMKLVLLVVYIVLGSIALKRGRTLGARRIGFVAALCVFLTMLAIAHTHHPLGPWLMVRGWLS